jgi:hypothetical protein
MSSRTRIMIQLPIVMFFGLTFVSAQSTAPPGPETLVVTRDATALQLLTNCWHAMGSPAPTEALQAQANVVPIARGAHPEQLTISIDGPGRMRLDTNRNGAIHTFIVADGQGYLSDDKTHNPNSYTRAMYPHAQLLPYLLCSGTLNDSRLTISYIGTETLQGVTADHLEVYTEMLDSGGTEDKLERRLSQVDIFLNHTTSLPIRAQSYSFELHNVTNSLLWTTDYSGYAPVQGVLMPTSTVEWVGAHQVLQYDWASIVLNPHLESSTFAIGGNQ